MTQDAISKMPELVAELGSNHLNREKRLVELVCAAKREGAQAVKLQVLRHQRLFHPRLHSKLQSPPLEVPDHWPELASDLAHSQGLKFYASVFSCQELELALPFLDGVKIASGDLTFRPLLEAALECGKPVILSTGASKASEIEALLELASEKRALGRLTLLHCVSAYPCPPSSVHLGMMRWLASLHSPVGYSDHSGDWRVLALAALLGAAMLEFHFDLKDGHGPEASHSLGRLELNRLTNFLNLAVSVSAWEPRRPLALEKRERVLARRRYWEDEEAWLRPASEDWPEVFALLDWS